MGSSRTSIGGTRTKVASLFATLIKLVGGLAVLILVAHIVLTLGDANPASGITTQVAYWAGRLQLGLGGLFTPADPKVRVALDYGLPAVVWLIGAWVLASLVRRLGR